MGNSNTFLTAEWRKLAMANYAVDPAILKPYVPKGTELDLWNNTCYVSLVGFMFVNTRLKGIPIPFHTNFEEVNLRFYVRYFENGNWKRGVVFIKEIVPKFMITFVANTLYKEHYQTLKMRHTWDIGQSEIEIEYAWKLKDWHRFKVIAEAQSQNLVAGEEPEFITQHFWGYNGNAQSETMEYEVGHPEWVVYPVKSYEIEVDFGLVYGSDFSFLNSETPVSVFLAEGSEIFVKGKRKLVSVK